MYDTFLLGTPSWQLGATKNSECLIAIEKIDPFNSHYLYETLLGVDEKYRSAERALCPLFKKIIENMWPELLEEPSIRREL